VYRYWYRNRPSTRRAISLRITNTPTACSMGRLFPDGSKLFSEMPRVKMKSSGGRRYSRSGSVVFAADRRWHENMRRRSKNVWQLHSFNQQSLQLSTPSSFTPTNIYRALARLPPVMFKHVVPKTSTRQLLRPGSQANGAFRASPSTFYLVDRLQQRRGYATPTGTE